jgi:hypothetical protein
MSKPSLFSSLSPEARLLATCVRTQVSSSVKKKRERILAKDLDWEWVHEQVRWHSIAPFVTRHLTSYKDQVPTALLEGWKKQARTIAFQNLAQMRELQRIVRTFETQDIPVIPFKGPLLAEMAYGDVTYRRFVDLDMLVHREDIQRAKACLKNAGYSPYRELSAEEELEHIDSGRGYEFVRKNNRGVVELHWALFFEIYDFGLDPEDVWKRHRTVWVGGTEMRTLSPEDLLIYLCAHGTKHRWMQIKWIADVAEHVRNHPDLDWSAVESRAQSIGYWRVVCLGAYLAEELLEMPTPPSVEQAARTDRRVPNMARQVVDEWLFRSPDAEPAAVWSTFWFHVKETDRWQGRWSYVKHHLKLWFGPTDKDREFIRLPKSFSPLYYLVRPVRRMFERIFSSDSS